MIPAIEVTHASKIYRRYSRRRQFATIKSALLSRSLIRDLEPDETFSALNDVSFTLPAGRTLGVIGRNGSGKSTMLKLVAGITKPTTGTVKVNGRISALIELGAGFHPEISGRENVFINGIMLGLTKKEIARRFDEIVEFAELQEFIDAPSATRVSTTSASTSSRSSSGEARQFSSSRTHSDSSSASATRLFGSTAAG